MESIVESFLEQGPPWLGDSAFQDKDVIKKAGGRFDGASKKWKAPDEATLFALIGDGKWTPVGHDRVFAGEVVRFILRRDKAAELAEQRRLRATMPPRPTHKRKKDECDVVKKHHTFQCDVCNTILDSREQFGLECRCADGIVWHACVVCFLPIRTHGQCVSCLEQKEKRTTMQTQSVSSAPDGY